MKRFGLFAAFLGALAACNDTVRTDPNVVTEAQAVLAKKGKIRTCGTRNHSDAEMARVQQEVDQHNRASGSIDVPQRPAGSVTVPVYFHVMRKAVGGNWNVTGDIPETVLNAQIDVLNQAYSGAERLAETGQSGPATPFHFVLAGVIRVDNSNFFDNCHVSSVETEMKSSRVGGCESLNIYTCGMTGSGLLGWATFPSNCMTKRGINLMDGVVILASSLPGGNAGAPDMDYHSGDSATHEIGHWLGLYHTFQGGCTKNNDYVSDTPAEASPDFNCTAGRDSCGGSRYPGDDPIHNYMDYNDDACMFEFTAMQSARMDSITATYR